MEHTEPIGCPIEPPKNDNPHFRIDEIEGKRVVVIGADAPRNEEILKAAIEVAKNNHIGVVVEDIDKYLSSPNVLDLNRGFAVPYLEAMSKIPFPLIHDPDIPNKLQLLKDLNLSPEQIDYFQNAPPHRLEGENQNDYKTRRMLNKLIIKYRGQF